MVVPVTSLEQVIKDAKARVSRPDDSKIHRGCVVAGVGVSVGPEAGCSIQSKSYSGPSRQGQKLQFGQTIVDLFRFPTKLGSKPLDAMIKVAGRCSVVMYGAGVWGF
ncbi:hypothetical protein NDU88_007077 [Pleurodeles waltl]|uniref:Uncharacterized protein n=1 Tax=Pleurodeles waltl TaxID=8319 RepID=A0AAV7LR11_PLEWA|nr:hypothetical protein NDU88_007077 [Pleurodeles waltl]